MPKFLNQKGLAPIIIIIIVGVAIMLIGAGVYNNSDCLTLTERSENRNISFCIINYLSGITKGNSGNGLSNPGNTGQSDTKNNSQNNNSTTQQGSFSNKETAKKPLSCDSLDILPSRGWSENFRNEPDIPYETTCDDELCSGTLGIVDGAYIGGKDALDSVLYARGSSRQKSAEGSTDFSCKMSFGSGKSFTDTTAWYKSKLDWMGSAQEKNEVIGSPTRDQSAWTYEKCYGGKVYHYTLTIMNNKDESYNPVEVSLNYDEIVDKDQISRNKPVGEGCITHEEWDRRFQNKLQDILNSK